ncbi:MAG: low molecular weight phosphotyrosine protein phosphatase [Calditrichaeota bacterium]|nr:low molecular weight phosphotyrosine protein phosphatase [Calditrichota bacterium]
MNILFVCLGNICRSPLAEGIFSDLIEKNQLDWVCDSAGTSGWHINEMPDHRSILIARENGIDISHQRSRKLQNSDFERFQYIIAMDKSNLENINQIQPRGTKTQIHMLRDFDPIDPGANVPDPYYGGEDGFRDCFIMIERSCKMLMAEIRKDNAG